MKIGVILLFSISFKNSYSRVPDFSSRLYLPLVKVSDVSFEIKANHINELITTKALGNTVDDIVVNAYKYNESIDLNIEGTSKIAPPIKAKLRELFLNKSKIVFGTNLKNWIADFKFVQSTNNWFQYEDESGVLDTMEVKLKFINRKLFIIEKRPTGTLKAEYFFEKKKWSKDLLVLVRVIRKIYEGNQSIITDSKIEYKKIEGFGWLPSVLVSKVVQNLNLGSIQKTNRELDEVFYFENYSINQKKSELWFAKQK